MKNDSPSFQGLLLTATPFSLLRFFRGPRAVASNPPLKTRTRRLKLARWNRMAISGIFLRRVLEPTAKVASTQIPVARQVIEVWRCPKLPKKNRNCWWNVWGIFQWYVGEILEKHQTWLHMRTGRILKNLPLRRIYGSTENNRPLPEDSLEGILQKENDLIWNSKFCFRSLQTAHYRMG